jgi:hypothetical protein
MGAKSSLDLDSDPRAIIGMREFDAPRDLVFDAWTDPKHLAQWWGPNGFTTTTMSFDLRPGGVWRFVMHGPDGRDYQNRITWCVQNASSIATAAAKTSSRCSSGKPSSLKISAAARA